MSEDIKLYEYPDEIDRILAEADDGELTPELLDRLDQVMQGLENKTRSVLAAIRSHERQAESCKLERDRLAGRFQGFQKKVDGLYDYLLRCMAHEETRKVVLDIGTISRVANNPNPVWTWKDRDPPEEFVKRREIVTIDREAVLKAHAEGRLPEGFVIEKKDHIRIR